MCKYGRYVYDYRPCCEECYLNRETRIVFYKDLYRKSDFLCDGSIAFTLDQRFQRAFAFKPKQPSARRASKASEGGRTSGHPGP